LDQRSSVLSRRPSNYAKNIAAAAAGTNVVTITFNKAANYSDIRILEYSGVDSVNPIDTFVAATGNNSTSNSVVLQTTNPTDLLVAANTVETFTTGTSSRFTQRILTKPDGDIAEDRIVSKLCWFLQRRCDPQRCR